MATQTATQVTQTLFEAIASSRNSYQMATSFSAPYQHITKHGVLLTYAQLAGLFTACPPTKAA